MFLQRGERLRRIRSTARALRRRRAFRREERALRGAEVRARRAGVKRLTERAEVAAVLRIATDGKKRARRALRLRERTRATALRGRCRQARVPLRDVLRPSPAAASGNRRARRGCERYERPPRRRRSCALEARGSSAIERPVGNVQWRICGGIARERLWHVVDAEDVRAPCDREDDEQSISRHCLRLSATQSRGGTVISDRIVSALETRLRRCQR